MLCDGSEQPASPTTRAGTPATVLHDGTSCSTTDPAAIRELWHAAQADLPRFRDVDLVIDVDPINLR